MGNKMEKRIVSDLSVRFFSSYLGEFQSWVPGTLGESAWECREDGVKI